MLHYSNAYIVISQCKNMPTLTIYLNNELYDKVKNSPSRIVKTALEKYFDNMAGDAEVVEQNSQ